MIPFTQTVEDWKRDLEGRSTRDAASYILCDMIGYRKTKHHDEDVVNLAHALEAYAALSHPRSG